MKTYLVENLDQLKLLSDDFKLKLIENFADGPATTKQVADRLGEKAPKLYRHVDALVDAGLLLLVEERPKRGTIERYYRPVADRFQVDSRLFGNDQPVLDESASMLRTLFQRTESDLLQLFKRQEQGDCDEKVLPTLVNLTIDAAPQVVEEFQSRLNQLLSDIEKMAAESSDDQPTKRWSSLIAFYPNPGDESAANNGNTNDN